MKLIHTNGEDTRFVNLCEELDQYLDQIVGKEKQQAEYNKYNNLNDIKDVILVLDGDVTAGCGSFKKYDANTAEVKRVFVKQCERRKGLSGKIMHEIENTAAEKGYSNLILETGSLLKGAQSLYKKLGFHVTENFGQYAGKNSSVCMKKDISSNEHSINKILYNLELELLKPEVRNSAERIDELLADDYLEFCSSGFSSGHEKGNTFYEERVTFDVSDFTCEKLADDCFMVHYISKKNYEDGRDSKIALRTSIWKNYDGIWKMYFHQGTPKSLKHNA